MNTAHQQHLTRIYRDGLLEDVLPFWTTHAVDHESGGFLTALDRDGTVIDTDKGVWQQARFTWLLGELTNCELLRDNPSRDIWLELARHGADFLTKHCFDPADGRMWFHVTRNGQPIRKRRYAFSESFAAIAYGELAQTLHSDEYAAKATQAFQRFITHSLTPPADQAKYTQVRPTRSLGFPMITINTAQQLRDSIGLEVANEWIDRSIEDIERYHLKADIQCVMETVSDTGEIINHFDGRTLNPGHAIEGAWFIMLEGRHRHDSRLVELGCTMLDWMWQRGWDNEYGGMLYFTDVYHLPVQEYWHDMKFWWPHNETIIATLAAYLLTGDEKYAQWHQLVHDWSYRHFPDPQHGEWFGYLHRDGRLSVPLKGNLWKGPFHLPRMLLTCWKLLEDSAHNETTKVLDSKRP
ncbi:AGE family epimerase/isomerase [Aeoliella mucimassa]|uniref:Cellobiose 2-epimerase n=1 Tax=Aeoliella mucimassa TaxID=2527972 RepID=A0A518AQI8_9BACT|nr:AGE family epimerase/isomerase [Aeoliella mucimassa]QDU56992.1 Cellobiose 2-epimerase [Aeoliella mucimassa]